MTAVRSHFYPLIYFYNTFESIFTFSPSALYFIYATMTFYRFDSKSVESTTTWFSLSRLLMVLGLAAHCFGQAKPSADSDPSSQVNLRTLITGTCEDVHRYVESLVGRNVIQSTVESALLCLVSMLGQENVNNMTMLFEMVIRFLAEGAASGLNVIAVYVTEILRVTGIDVTLQFPRFTPEGVAAVAQWGLLALIGYWVLTFLLRLLVGVLRRVFWMLKMVLALWFFGLIVNDRTATTDTTAFRLAGLVLTCVLLGLASPGSEQPVSLNNRLSHLEGRLKAVERKKGE